MYVVEKLVDGKWHYQCSTPRKEQAIERVDLYAQDDVVEFKTCDAVRVVDSETNEVIKMYPVYLS